MLTFRETERLRRLALVLAMVVLFLRVSYLQQVQTAFISFNFRLLYVFGTPALVGIVVAGGVQRSFRGRPALYWTAYVVWIALAVPFSLWKGGSFWRLLNFLRSDFVMLFALAGLTVTWRECKALMNVIACGAAVNLVSARLFAQTTSQGRFGLEFGSIQNPNDFAAHLLFALPFVMWVAFSSRALLLRGLAALGVAFGLYLILATASRGALVALVADILFVLFRGTARQKAALAVGGPVVLALICILVPRDSLRRISSFSGGEDALSQEAEASAEGRKYVLRKSLEYSIEHPLFGVGPGLFATYEGTESRAVGERGYWHVTHNAYTQAASECGIPALLFFAAGIISSLRLLSSTLRAAGRLPGCGEIRTAAFCIMLSIVGFSAAIFFLSLAYSFYLPAMGGLAVACHGAIRNEFSAREDLVLPAGRPGRTASSHSPALIAGIVPGVKPL